MDVRVRFRFNKVTGDVEELLVEDVGSHLSEADHDREHDRIAAEIGRVVERHPLVVEVAPAAEPQRGDARQAPLHEDAAERDAPAAVPQARR